MAGILRGAVGSLIEQVSVIFDNVDSQIEAALIASKFVNLEAKATFIDFYAYCTTLLNDAAQLEHPLGDSYKPASTREYV